jgi:hypothetical protein
VEEVISLRDINLEELKKSLKAEILIVGFKCEAARNQLLESARHLEDTVFKDVSVAPDLTRNHREEEENMKEMEKRNANLSQEDKQKNLTWAVVGTKGEKRLVKTTVKAQQANRRTAAATAPRGPVGNGQALGTRQQAAAAETRRERRGSKRGERSDEEEMEVTQPPAKR